MSQLREEPRPSQPLLAAEREYCSEPSECLRPDVLVVGSAVGMVSLHYLQARMRGRGLALSAVLAEAGPMDFLSHAAHSRVTRGRFVRRPGRFGGNLVLWGVSAPRPRDPSVFPYEQAELERRFAAVEAELGVPDQIPMSGRALECNVQERLVRAFPELTTRVAPLAIDRRGWRFSPLDRLEELVARDARLLGHFRVTELVRRGPRIVAVRGRWRDGREYTLRPKVVVLAVGVEPALPLLAPLYKNAPVKIEASDHHRIDLHGCLPADSPLGGDPEALGIAVLITEGRGGEGRVPFHVEIKVAPKCHWAAGYMQSSDNLRGRDDDRTLYGQIQVVAAMHDRLPANDLLNVAGPLAPVMSARDARFHSELVALMTRIAASLGLDQPLFNCRPLLTNHHAYGAFRVGGAVTASFRWRDIENLYVLPPTSYIDSDDDANPTLKSLVLSRYAMDDVMEVLAETSPHHNEQLALT